MKTVSVALVLCLNVGVDPPDIVKTQPCARLECWIGKQHTEILLRLHNFLPIAWLKNLDYRFNRNFGFETCQDQAD